MFPKKCVLQSRKRAQTSEDCCRGNTFWHEGITDDIEEEILSGAEGIEGDTVEAILFDAEGIAGDTVEEILSGMKVLQMTL